MPTIEERNARDLAIINANAERLNREAADALTYQVDLNVKESVKLRRARQKRRAARKRPLGSGKSQPDSKKTQN